MAPVINTGQHGATLTYTEVFSDEFDTDGPGPGPNWNYWNVENDGLHRAGNAGLDAAGNVYTDGGGDPDVNYSVSGKRWAAYYDRNNSDDICYRAGGKLYMGGRVDNVTDPTRIDYTHQSTDYNWNQVKVTTVGLVTWDRVWSNSAGTHVTDPNSPNILFGPGHFFEIKVDFSAMASRGFRLSFWLMSKDGVYTQPRRVETDIFEYENWSGSTFNGSLNAGNILQQKVIGGVNGSTPNGSIDVSAFGLDSGVHTIGLLWEDNRLTWYVDGVQTQFETELNRIPDSDCYMLLTREVNAGPKDSPVGNEIQSVYPKIPEDVGLYAVSAYDSINDIDTDKGVVEYIKVWQVGTGTGGGTGEPPIVDTTPVDERFWIERPDAMIVGKAYQARAMLPQKRTPSQYTYLWTLSEGLANRVDVLRGLTNKELDLLAHTAPQSQIQLRDDVYVQSDDGHAMVGGETTFDLYMRVGLASFGVDAYLMSSSPQRFYCRLNSNRTVKVRLRVTDGSSYDEFETTAALPDFDAWVPVWIHVGWVSNGAYEVEYSTEDLVSHADVTWTALESTTALNTALHSVNADNEFQAGSSISGQNVDMDVYQMTAYSGATQLFNLTGETLSTEAETGEVWTPTAAVEVVPSEVGTLTCEVTEV